MDLRPLVCIVALAPLAVVTSHHVALASDPIETFIVRADSIATASGDKALADFIAENRALAGAAAGRLADVALQLRAGGQVEAAMENLDFAERIAEAYRSQTGSSAPLDLVRRYQGWNDSQEATRREAKALEEAAIQTRDAGDYDRAIGLLDDAMALYDSIGDSRSTAILWGSLGVVCWYKGDFETVAGHYARALAARRAIEDRILEGKTLNGLGSVNYQLGNLDLARDYYEQAIELRQQTGDIGGLATSLTYLGNVYLAMGRLVGARTTLEQALPVVESTGNKAKQYELLTSIAGMNAEMGRTSSSNRTLREALALACEMEDPKRQAVCHNNLALNLAEAYRYGEALRELDAARALLDQHPDPEQAVVYYRNSGITNMRMGELEWAQSDFDTVLEMAQRHQMPAFQLEALINLGYLLKEQGEFEKGLWYARDARELAEEIGSPRLVREALVLRAELEHNLARYDAAIETWELLLAQDRMEGNEAKIVMDLMGVANNHILAERSEEAREILRDVGPVVEGTGEGDLILALAFGMGHSFEDTEPESALLYYEKALGLLDEARREIGVTEIKTGYLGGVRRFYFEEVATYYASLACGDESDLWSGRAFQTIERAKARGLLDLIEAPVLASGSPAEDALLDSLYSLDPEGPAYEERARKIKSQYHRVRNERLETAGGGRAGTVAAAAPEDIRRILPERTAMLAYAVGDTASLLWVIDADGCEVHRLPRRSILQDGVAQLRDAIAHPVIEDAALRRAARQLYLDVIAPAGARIDDAEHLIVVPDGVLFELPFGTLLTEEPAGTAWEEMPYLVRAHAISYIPSASIYLALRTGAGDTEFDRDLLALGDPEYSMLKPLPGVRRDLVRLPYSREEVLNISSKLEEGQKDLHLGRDANEAMLKSKLRTESIRVVHLATHGFVDPSEPTSSGIVLCPDVEGTEDGYFQTLEVMALPMDVGLVVLSACESGRGQIGRGEGVVGLSRAFLASGTRAIVASLWPVSDESTARLMEEFYGRMFENRQPAVDALNEARLVLIDDPRHSHPFHWSSFVVIGLEDSPW
jgi:CHAT domain-containing protein/tetratricopeptide (TPR) repeat protein